MAKTNTVDQVVKALAAVFPDADPGPAGLWGFVNAGWTGAGEDIEDWVAAWREAERETEAETSVC